LARTTPRQSPSSPLGGVAEGWPSLMVDTTDQPPSLLRCT